MHVHGAKNKRYILTVFANEECIFTPFSHHVTFAGGLEPYVSQSILYSLPTLNIWWSLSKRTANGLTVTNIKYLKLTGFTRNNN